MSANIDNNLEIKLLAEDYLESDLQEIIERDEKLEKLLILSNLFYSLLRENKNFKLMYSKMLRLFIY